MSKTNTKYLPLLLALLTIVWIAGCSKSDSQNQAKAGQKNGNDVVQTYHVRGRIKALPNAQVHSQLQIDTEAVPNFVGMSGKVVGMEPMVMPYPVAKGVSIADLHAGDAVAFTFEMRWHGEPPYQITAIHKLPTDTKLDLTPAPATQPANHATMHMADTPATTPVTQPQPKPMNMGGHG